MIGLMVVAFLLVSTTQNAIFGLGGPTWVKSLDDLLLGLLLLSTFPRWMNLIGLPIVASIVWTALVGWAFVFSVVQGPLALLVARQLLVPVLCLVIGLALRREEMVSGLRIWIYLSVGNAFYVFLEVWGVFLIDPAAGLESNSRIFLIDGIPGYYHYFTSSGQHWFRGGGLFLNPPIAGIALATAAVASSTMEGRRYRIFTVLLVAATIFTISRAGIVILVFGLLGSAISRRAGLALTVVGFVAATLLAGMLVADDAGSGSHLDGLVEGLRSGLSHPFGEGIGTNGNYLSAAGVVAVGESLLGIALSAMGLVVLVFYLTAILGIARSLPLSGPGTASLLWGSLGLLGTAAVSETAGALAGAGFGWILLGQLLGSGLHDRRRRNSKLQFV